MKRGHILATLILSGISFTNFIQAQTPKGTWREHLPYNEGKVVAITDERVYCATNLSLFYYDKTDGSIQKLSKINGLSDLGIGYVAYNEKNKKLLVGFSNGNIDLFEGDTKINFPDIKMKNMVADKSIYHISMVGDFAYISFGFGIVVFNLQKNEISDTYILGAGGSYMKVNGTAIFNDSIFACTDKGLYKAAIGDPFLSNYTNWEKETGLYNPSAACYTPVVYGNQLFVLNKFSNPESSLVNRNNGQKWDTIFTNLDKVRSLSVSNNKLVVIKIYHVLTYNQELSLELNYSAHYAQHALYDEDGKLWLADSKEGLLLNTPEKYKTVILPDGPPTSNVFEICYQNNQIAVLPGGYRRSGEAAFLKANAYTFSNETWNSFDKATQDSLAGVSDAVCMASNSQYTYIGTWGNGLIELKNGVFSKIYRWADIPELGSNFISSLNFDSKGNLWIIARKSQTPIIVKTATGEWYSYSYDGSLSNIQTYKSILTSNGDFWHVGLRGEGVFIWNTNQTPATASDDKYTSITIKDKLSTYSQEVNDIVEDLDGTIWLGTADGVVVYDYPYNALSQTIYARKPQLVVDGYLKNLLEGESVTSIAVDGANRKWIGTDGGGLFLVSADGTEQIMVLNVENSKLISDNIISVEINQKTGEVFIGTDKGVQSYMSTATASQPDFNAVHTFPNPVKEGYNGFITIRGLMSDTEVKITDLSGHLVFETMSNGGDAIWNGKNLNGENVETGIYLVFCVTPLGSETQATKILIVR
ncbi:MAG TPA: hypothetical protein DD653_10875 [Marinilabiliales bacterium]|jgi:ligand-binding sensor domain-containing protein|nr:MAG: hypothetical protein A2W84_06210 [Bacteroidetes bacterium GWC2_40_13]HBO75174.1 hypothetical protein [Marinilabiliales bacterium]